MDFKFSILLHMACMHNSVGVKQERNERNDKEKEKTTANRFQISHFTACDMNACTAEKG